MSMSLPPPQQWHATLNRQLDELTLIQCSLLPGEHLTLTLPPLDLTIWQSLLDLNDDNRNDRPSEAPCPARFEIRIDGAKIWFQVDLPSCTTTQTTPLACPLADTNTSIAVKGENVSRSEQERWNALIRDRIAEIDESACEFPVYELLTLLLPTLHDQSTTSASTSAPTQPPPPPPEPPHHALLTSHHLLSTTKRRLMHQWSHDLSITGFAKVGYPGVIYAEGPREAVEEFVANVKGMQWLALRVRFQEPVPNPLDVGGSELARRERWVEVSKVGEVLEWMRKRDREALVTSLGIGAPSKQS